MREIRVKENLHIAPVVVSQIEKAIIPEHALLQPQLKEQQHKSTQMSESEEITLLGEEEDGSGGRGGGWGGDEQRGCQISIHALLYWQGHRNTALSEPFPRISRWDSMQPAPLCGVSPKTLRRCCCCCCCSITLTRIKKKRMEKKKAVKAWQRCCQ